MRDGVFAQPITDHYPAVTVKAAREQRRNASTNLSNMAVHEHFAIGSMRWETTRPGGALFPALDADIKLTSPGKDVTGLAISGTCRPPLDSMGAGLDRMIIHKIALATIRAFTCRIAAAIEHPAASPESRHTGTLPEPSSWPEIETQ